MEARYVIGVDSSTTATKAIVWTLDGKPVGEGREEYEVISPRPGWGEQKAEVWLSAFVKAVRAAIQGLDPRQVCSLGITHQRETFVPVDSNGDSLSNAILWLDARAVRQVRELEVMGAERVHALTGKVPDLTASICKLMWLRDNKPEVFERACKYLDVYAYLVWKLTGELITCWPSADPTGLLDMANLQWATGLMEEIGLSPAQFPELRPPGEIVGRLTKEAADLLGLLPGLLVAGGGGDGQCAGIGVGAVTHGSVYLNLGTAVVSGMLSESYIYSRGFRTLCGCIPHTYIAEALIRGGASTIKWFVNSFGQVEADFGGKIGASAEELLEFEARKVPPGSLGLITVPYWNTASMPYWDPLATGITVGWRNSHGRAHFYRSILEGVAFEQRNLYQGMEQAISAEITEVRATGGGARSPLWCQILADVAGVPIKTIHTPEATCLGAAMLAASACGAYGNVREASTNMSHVSQVYEPHMGRAEFYERIFQQVYLPLFPSIRESIDILGELVAGSVGPA